ncbi:hypothetical protein HN011_006918 [Eciton burchellii]|jgi:hypothetical protein|nr:hypothetical protein HN011_006918 [Eciton burchellii]
MVVWYGPKIGKIDITLASLKIIENYKFYQKKRKKKQFLAILHKLDSYCKFGYSLKILFKNYLVFSILNEKAQIYVLERKNLIFDEAVNIVTIKLPEKDSEQMKSIEPSDSCK